MRYLPLLLLAGCTTVTPEMMAGGRTAEVCYLGAVRPELREMATNELRRRGHNCENHLNEIQMIHQQQMARQASRDAVMNTLILNPQILNPQVPQPAPTRSFNCRSVQRASGLETSCW